MRAATGEKAATAETGVTAEKVVADSLRHLSVCSRLELVSSRRRFEWPRPSKRVVQQIATT